MRTRASCAAAMLSTPISLSLCQSAVLLRVLLTLAGRLRLLALSTFSVMGKKTGDDKDDEKRRNQETYGVRWGLTRYALSVITLVER